MRLDVPLVDTEEFDRIQRRMRQNLGLGLGDPLVDTEEFTSI